MHCTQYTAHITRTSVYGSAEVPITEETTTGVGITNAYGRTKYMIEEILTDFKRFFASILFSCEHFD